MSDNLRDQIETTASNPQRVRTDAGEVESHDLEKLVEADRYLSAARAAKTKNRGLRFSTIVPPGSYS
jgi:hypothetical protein